MDMKIRENKKSREKNIKEKNKNEDKKNNHKDNRGSMIALLPIGVFLIIFLGSGIVLKDFYAMPSIVAFLIALLVAFMQNRELTFEQKIKVISKGVGEENIITMCLILLCAGGFSGAVTAAGGVDSTINLGLSVLPAHFAVVGLFIISCFISVSMGTSMGTIAALAPIAVGISEKTDYQVAICIGAVMCGAMFGDNLSMISDTTIAAVKTQGCEMKDKFKENFLIVLPAALITIIIFLMLSLNGEYVITEELSYNIFRIIPYIIVFVGALLGINVFVILIVGTVVALIVGVSTGAIVFDEIFIAVGGGEINGQTIGGVMGMYDITVISITVACIVSLVKEYGGVTFILNKIKRKIKGEKGAELGIAGLALLVDVCTANNTVAIVISGPIVKEISDEYDVTPKRAASLLDIFSSAGQGILPYGSQLLSAATLTSLTPFNIIPYLFYPILMAVSALMFILLRKRKV